MKRKALSAACQPLPGGAGAVSGPAPVWNAPVEGRSRPAAGASFPAGESARLLPAGSSLSALSLWESPAQLVQRLVPFDVVSFDVFDTLLLRAVERPQDAFALLGAKLGYPHFARLRDRGGRPGPAAQTPPGNRRGDAGGNLAGAGTAHRPVSPGGHGRRAGGGKGPLPGKSPVPAGGEGAAAAGKAPGSPVGHVPARRFFGGAGGGGRLRPVFPVPGVRGGGRLQGGGRPV